MHWKDVKHALISILVGATVSFFTVLFQGILVWLQSIPPEIPGTLAGMARYAVFLYHRQPPPYV